MKCIKTNDKLFFINKIIILVVILLDGKKLVGSYINHLITMDSIQNAFIQMSLVNEIKELGQKDNNKDSLYSLLVKKSSLILDDLNLSDSDTEAAEENVVNTTKQQLRQMMKILAEDTKKLKNIICLFFKVQEHQELIMAQEDLKEYRILILGTQESLTNIKYIDFINMIKDAICTSRRADKEKITLLFDLSFQQANLLTVMNSKVSNVQKQLQIKQKDIITEEEAIQKTNICVSQEVKKVREEYENKISQYKIFILVCIFLALGRYCFINK